MSELARRAARAPQFFTALTELAAGRMVAVAGGVLIRAAGAASAAPLVPAAGAIIGAVGISGDASEKDEDCAVRGIAATGLVADTGGEDPR